MPFLLHLFQVYGNGIQYIPTVLQLCARHHILECSHQTKSKSLRHHCHPMPVPTQLPGNYLPPVCAITSLHIAFNQSPIICRCL